MVADHSHRLAGADGARVAALHDALHETGRLQLELNEMEHVHAEVLARRLRGRLDGAARGLARETYGVAALSRDCAGYGRAALAVDWLLEIIEHGEDEVALHAIAELRRDSIARSLRNQEPGS